MTYRHPHDLWQDHEEAWTKLMDAFKKEEQDYVNFCVKRVGETIASLKKFYIDHGENFEKIWIDHILKRKNLQ